MSPIRSLARPLMAAFFVSEGAHGPYHRGQYLHGVMMRERVTRGELLAAVRSKGHAGIEDVIAIVLETDGTISVVSDAATAESALRNVQGVRD